MRTMLKANLISIEIVAIYTSILMLIWLAGALTEAYAGDLFGEFLFAFTAWLSGYLLHKLFKVKKSINLRAVTYLCIISIVVMCHSIVSEVYNYF
jgi:ABC-type antimicrobial peptide transport system permease subunit